MDAHSNKEQRASKTAMMAAVHRYLSQFEPNPDFHTQDTLAKLFIPRLWKFLIGFAWFRRFLLKKLNREVPGTYPYVIARAKYFDEQFIHALKEYVPQIVLLGSGYDTRAIRYQTQNQGSTVFELDTPALLKNKQAIFKQNGIDIPDRLKLCPIIFGKDDLATVLKQADFDLSLKTLFMWEGVNYYLPEPAVDETLSFIKENTPTGSTLVFDYFYQSFIDGNHDYYGAKEIATAVQEVGEPFQFGIEPESLASFLADFGFELLSHYNSGDLEQTYLSSLDGQLGKVYGFAECVTAIRI